MINMLKSLFSENSDISMMRLMSLMSLLIGAYLAVKGHDISVGVFVYAAFGGKAVQKYIESKKDDSDDSVK